MFESTFNFLNRLSQNNNREWFKEHKEEFDALKEQYKAFFDKVENDIIEYDKIESSKIYRIYRDIRFKKDKTPYHTHIGVDFIRQKPENGLYYIHIENDNNFLAAGFYMLEKDELFKIRKEISYTFKDLEKIIKKKDFQNFFGGEIQGEELKTAPKGFEKDHPAVNFLRKKQFYITRSLTNEEVCSDDFLQKIDKTFRASLDFQNYISEAMN